MTIAMTGFGFVPRAGPSRASIGRLLRPAPRAELPWCAPAQRQMVEQGLFEVEGRRQIEQRRPLLGPCGPGGLPCMVDLPESALSGLGFQSTFCSEWATEMNTLGLLLAEAERVGATQATAYQQAKRHYDAKSSTFWFQDPVLPSTCRRETDEAKVLTAALRTIITSRGGDPGVAPPSVESPGFPWLKVAIVGGVTVVGIIGVAYFTGNLARLWTAIKK